MNIKDAYIEIDRLFDAGEISNATYQTAEDWIGLCDIDEQGDEEIVKSTLEVYTTATIDELKKDRHEDLIGWRDEIDEEEFAERFEIGDGFKYSTIEEHFKDINFEFIHELIRTYFVEKKQ